MVPQQQVTIGPAPMEEVERINIMMTRNLGRQMGSPRMDPYVMDMDKGRNCYNCEGFGHLVRDCKNRETEKRIGKGRRLEYGQGNNGQ